MKETKTVHTYYFYGRWVEGYGPSMDPHICGDENEPCVTAVLEREVSDWEITVTKVQPSSYKRVVDDRPETLD